VCVCVWHAHPCALVLAQLARKVGRLTELGVRLG
jgi:hypothetical protein